VGESCEHVGLYKFLSSSSRARRSLRGGAKICFFLWYSWHAPLFPRAATAGCSPVRVLSDSREELESCGKRAHEFARCATRDDSVCIGKILDFLFTSDLTSVLRRTSTSIHYIYLYMIQKTKTDSEI